jgi:hypothetical protein
MRPKWRQLGATLFVVTVFISVRLIAQDLQPRSCFSKTCGSSTENQARSPVPPMYSFVVTRSNVFRRHLSQRIGAPRHRSSTAVVER